MQNQIKSASFRFYAELNDFLPPRLRFTDIFLTFKGRQTVKHLAESLGVPHPEIDLIIVNGRPVDFETITQDGDRVSIYPLFETIEISSAIRLLPQPMGDPRFILDGHLGRLAAYLRMLGFDTACQNDIPDDLLADQAVGEHRILLTRDCGLLKRKAILRGYCLRSSDPLQQLREIIRRFDLRSQFQPFTRCMGCKRSEVRTPQGCASRSSRPDYIGFIIITLVHMGEFLLILNINKFCAQIISIFIFLQLFLGFRKNDFNNDTFFFGNTKIY